MIREGEGSIVLTFALGRERADWTCPSDVIARELALVRVSRPAADMVSWWEARICDLECALEAALEREDDILRGTWPWEGAAP